MYTVALVQDDHFVINKTKTQNLSIDQTRRRGNKGSIIVWQLILV